MIAIKEQFVTDTSGATTGVFIAKGDYDQLIEYIEELEDITAYREEKAKGDQPTFKWKDVRRS